MYKRENTCRQNKNNVYVKDIPSQDNLYCRHYTVIFLLFFFCFPCFADSLKYKPIGVAYDRTSKPVPISSEPRHQKKWYLDVNRLLRSGMPFKDVSSPDGETKLPKEGGAGTAHLSKAKCLLLIGGGKTSKAKSIREFVRTGGGLVVYGRIDPKLADIMPVSLQSNSLKEVNSMKGEGFVLELKAKKSLLTKIWRINNTGLLIPHRGSIFEAIAKPKAEVLADFVDSSGKHYPALVSGRFGRGRIIYFAGTLDRIYKTLGDKYPLFPLDLLWTEHPAWDISQMLWIAWVAKRSDIVKLVCDYWSYLDYRKQVFSRAANLIQTNDQLRVKDVKTANTELAAAKSALWQVERADRKADAFKITPAIKELHTIMDSLPPARTIPEPVKSSFPGDGTFWIAGSMCDMALFSEAYNQEFVKSFFKKYKGDFHFDGEACYFSKPLTHLRGHSYPEKLLKPSDFLLEQSIALQSMSDTGFKVIPTVMQNNLIGRQRRLFTRRNCLKKAPHSILPFSPEFDWFYKPFYLALGEFCQKHDDIAAVEYNNEPSVFRGDIARNAPERLNLEFYAFLKKRYGGLAAFNQKFKLHLKRWQELPAWYDARKKLKQECDISGDSLDSSDKISWFISSKADIADYSQLKNTGWEKITVPAFWEGKFANTQGQLWYKVKVPIKDSYRHGIKIHFMGVDDEAKVYVKGKLLKTSKSHNTPFSVSIPQKILKRGNFLELYIAVNNTFGNGGIYKPVILQTKTTNNILHRLSFRPDNQDRLVWGLWGQFCREYSVEGCKRFISYLREKCNKPMVDRSRGAAFDMTVWYEGNSAICDVFGPHASSRFAQAYAAGMNRAPNKIISEYYFIGYGEKDPITGKTPDPGKFLGTLYRKHPRAEYLLAGLARKKFWEIAACGFDGMECFVPVRFLYPTSAWTIEPRNRWDGVYWSYYSSRFEPRIPILSALEAAWEYKNIYPHVHGSQAVHNLYILVDQASITQSQLNPVNDLHHLKRDARSLYGIITQKMYRQPGFIDAERLSRLTNNSPCSGKVIFVVGGQFISLASLKALREFMQKGGTVIAFGPVGIFDSYGRGIHTVSQNITGTLAAYKITDKRARIMPSNLSVKFSKYAPGFVFDVKSKATPGNYITLNNKSYLMSYSYPVGKGHYVQYGIVPRVLGKVGEADNVDEAVMKQSGNQKVPLNIQEWFIQNLFNLLQQRADPPVVVCTKGPGDIFIRKKKNKLIVFLINRDIMASRDIGIKWPATWRAKLLYATDSKKLKGNNWHGSISPGGARIFELIQ